ncbi:MAG: hypothetical protein QXL33_05575 [Sulfolobaceae archaeon]
MRWIKKREIVIYFLLYKKFKYETFNLGEAFEVLKPYFSKKVIISTLKYFNKIGLASRLSEFNYRLYPFEEFLFMFTYDYLQLRNRRRRKGKFYSSS